MSLLRRLRFARLALPALWLVLGAGPVAAAMSKAPFAAETCGVSGRCGASTVGYIGIRHPEDD